MLVSINLSWMLWKYLFGLINWCWSEKASETGTPITCLQAGDTIHGETKLKATARYIGMGVNPWHVKFIAQYGQMIAVTTRNNLWLRRICINIEILITPEDQKVILELFCVDWWCQEESLDVIPVKMPFEGFRSEEEQKQRGKEGSGQIDNYRNKNTLSWKS